MTDDRGNIIPQKDDELMAKHLSEIKALIEKNNALQAVVEQEPRKVLSKVYIEGTPNSLKNIANGLLNSYQYDGAGKQLDRTLALTLMIEDITPEKKK